MKILLIVYFCSMIAFANEMLSKLQQQTAANVAVTLNGLTSVENLLGNSKLESSIKESIRAEVGASYLKEKLSITAKEDNVELALKKTKRLTIKLVNPLMESFLVNNYATSLLGKTDLEKYMYLKKIIRSTSNKSNASVQGKLSILIPPAMAAEKSTWLKDEEVSALALATAEITNAAKTENCNQFKTNAQFKSSYIDALKNRFGGIAENFTYGELAAKVGVSFWCGNFKSQVNKPIVSFYVRCDGKKVESLSYGAREAIGANVGYINKTEKLIVDKTASSIIEARFGKDFSNSVAKCCESAPCASQVNLIAPISASTPLETHNQIKTKTSN